MPDTYISQFSGEEIDAALRAAQIISGASTPAELRKKLEIRGDTIPVSAEDSTLISGALKYRTNPNLLDNWYFGNPVNQKSGYYIPAGVKYNTLSWTEAGTTDKAYPVVGYIGQDPFINVNGTNYIVSKSVQVPGYCAAGYTVDRWRTGYDGTFTVNVSDAGVSLVSGNDGSWKNLYEIIETSKLIVGRTYTFSFLAEDNGGVRQVYILDYGSVFDGDKGLYTITFVAKETTRNQDFGIQTNVGKTSIPIAAKLELGNTQTLAHQDSSGNWILNEIPDFGEQLRRCQRYHLGDMQRDAPGRVSGNNTAYCVVPIPVTMRQSSAVPILAISKYGNVVDKDGAFHVVNNAQCVVEADSYLLCSVSSTETMPVGPCVWQDAHFSISKDL